jgi:hypothetical protein
VCSEKEQFNLTIAKDANNKITNMEAIKVKSIFIYSLFTRQLQELVFEGKREGGLPYDHPEPAL